MTVKRVWLACVLGAAVAACAKDTTGVQQTPPPLAGLRYFHAVPDTGYMDFRFVDIVAYAPNTVGAAFRTGGNPNGVTTSLPPPYLSVQTGTHHIKVFKDSVCISTPCASDLKTDSTVMFDTTVTFTQNHNYTFILYGSARAKAMHALVLDDTTLALPSDTNSTIWVRTLNLAGDTTGLGVPDVHVTTAAAPAATDTVFTGPAYLTRTAYKRVKIGALNSYFTYTGTLTPVNVTGTLPAGVLGTSTADPVAGALVKNSAVTILILPRSTPGAGVAKVYATPGVVYLIDQNPPHTAP